ncbi:MAG: protein involved in polysaccharide export with SLBB domain [Planctomycetota bacterium]|jgi:protein involved in polysaccharide export with SLBB domain
MRSTLLISLILGLLASCSTTSNEHLRLQARSDDSVIGPGDTVTVVDDMRKEAIMASARITADGQMEVPGLGLVDVSGMTARQLRRSLADQYVDIYGRTDLSVDVLAPDQRYYVYGEVSVPGRFDLSNGCTVFEAVERAQVDRNTGDLTKVRLVRGTLDAEQVTHFNVRRMARGDLSFNMVLLDGDILYVPPTAVGQVLSPVMSRPAPADPEVRRLRIDPNEEDEY